MWDINADGNRINLLIWVSSPQRPGGEMSSLNVLTLVTKTCDPNWTAPLCNQRIIVNPISFKFMMTWV